MRNNCVSDNNCGLIQRYEGLTLPRLGGNSNNGARYGAFARNFNNDASNQNWNRRGRETISKTYYGLRSCGNGSQLNQDANAKASRLGSPGSPNECMAPKIVTYEKSRPNQR